MGHPFAIDSTKINPQKLVDKALKKPFNSAHPEFGPIDFSSNKTPVNPGLLDKLDKALKQPIKEIYQ